MRHPSAGLAGSVVALVLAACSSAGESGSSGTTSSASGGTGGASGGGDTEPAAMAGMLEAHNAARASVMPAASPAIPPLVWSDTVAAAAQTWANNCMFAHNTDGYGQNIFAGSGAYKPPAVVAAWVAEAANYDYANNSCSAVCGHYTQVVWRDSAELGCGMAMCTENSPFSGGDWELWVCNYSPAGNFDGEKPY
jgi:uncharacterized protein YkwD